MEELERRVWQRVAAREEAPGEADTELLLRRCRELERELGALAGTGACRGSCAGRNRKSPGSWRESGRYIRAAVRKGFRGSAAATTGPGRP